MKVNSEASNALFHKEIDANFAKHKHTTYEWRHGTERSLDANALLHIWLLEYGCFLAGLNTKGLESKIREGIIEGVKQAAKKKFYEEFRYSWMIYYKIPPVQKSWKTFWKKKNVNPTKKLEFRSSRKYKVAEMFEFMTWLQATALNDDCLLESTGEYQKRQKKERETQWEVSRIS